MFPRMGLRPILACAVLCAFAPLAPAQSKVAIINLQKALFETAEVKKADADMQAKFKPRNDEIEKLSKEIDDIARQLQAGQGKLSPQQEADLNALGSTKQRSLKYKQDDLQQDANTYKNEVLSKLTEKMSAVVKKLAEDKGLDVVIDVNTTIYFKPALDITAEATAAYDKSYPVTAAPPGK